MMKTQTLKTFTFLLALLPPLAFSRPARAVGELAGRVAGTITEAGTGAPIPGATVTATSKALIGKPRVAVTDDSGHYEFVELPPSATTTGTYPYDVEVSFG